VLSDLEAVSSCSLLYFLSIKLPHLLKLKPYHALLQANFGIVSSCALLYFLYFQSTKLPLHLSEAKTLPFSLDC
jgi:hypothetical protein